MLKFPVGYIFRKVLNGDNMTVKFYKISEDRKVVDKSLIDTGLNANLVKTCSSVHYKDDVDVLNPVLEISYDASLVSANYVYVQEWGRYYYINNITTGMQRLYFSCHVDVLKTYKNGIKQLKCIIERQESKSNGKLYMADKAFKSEVRKIISTRKLSGRFDKSNSSFILTTGGRS